MKRLVYLFTTLVIVLGLLPRSNAQMQYNETNAYLKANAYWAMYNYIGIDWSSGVPVYDSNVLSSLDTLEGYPQYFTSKECASRAVSDPYTGSLLFYAGGVGPYRGYRNKIINRNHTLMLNSDSLLGNSLSSFSQGQCIIPVPGDSTKYYVFSLGHGLVEEEGRYQLYYNVVDITMNNGSGGIIAKNIIVDSNLFIDVSGSLVDRVKAHYALVAIPGNSCDVWLVTHVQNRPYDTAKLHHFYYAYRITETGVSSDPVVSRAYSQMDGVQGPGVDDVQVGISGFVVSPNREWILSTQSWPFFGGYVTSGSYESMLPPAELGMFDPNTGEVVSTQSFAPRLPRLSSDTTHYYKFCLNVITAAFSPDNSKLYTISSDIMGGQIYLIQYDLTLSDSSSIMASQTVIDSFGNYQNPPNTLFCISHYVPALKLYNDTIFVSFGDMNKMGSINRPNESGGACEFQLDYFSLPLDKAFGGGREFNEVVYPMYTEGILVLDTNTCQPMTLEPRVTDLYANYKWNTGETSSTITVPFSGTYWVSYSFLNDNCVYIYTDTFRLTGEGVNPPPVITINVDTLSTAASYETYQWLYEDQVVPGETNRKLTVTKNGDYKVIVTNAAGCSDTSEKYTVDNRETNIKALSGLEIIQLYPNPTRDKIYIQYHEDVYYRVLDATGRVLSDLKQGHQVDLSMYASGMYQLIILGRDKRKLGSFKVSKL